MTADVIWASMNLVEQLLIIGFAFAAASSPASGYAGNAQPPILDTTRRGKPIMRILASIVAAVLLLAGCGSNKPAGSAASAAPSTVTVATTPSATQPVKSATPAPVTPSSVEQAEVNYQEAVCTAALQIYVSVQEKSDRPPSYSRAVKLGLDGCVALTEAQYEQAVVRWAKLGD